MATNMRIAMATVEDHRQIRRQQTMNPTGRKLKDTKSGLHFTFKPLRYYFSTALKFFCVLFLPIS
jgi:hypothetical protein